MTELKIDYSVLKTHPVAKTHEAGAKWQKNIPDPVAISVPAREDFDRELLAMVEKWTTKRRNEH